MISCILPLLFVTVAGECELPDTSVHSGNLLQKRHSRSALNVTRLTHGFGPVEGPTSFAASFARGGRKPSPAGPDSFEGCGPSGAASHRATTSVASAKKTNSTLVRMGSTCGAGQVSLLDFSGGSVSETCCPGDSSYCAGCAKFANGGCAKCLGGYVQVGGKCLACINLEGFMDPLHRSCAMYESNGWCTGGAPVSTKWQQDTPSSQATMAEFTYHGASPTEACCACGGGTRMPTPFKYPASGKSLLVGQAIQELPQPRTAVEYVADPGCALHSLGLHLDARTGAVTGTASEATQVECQITAKEGSGLEFNASLVLDFVPFTYGKRALDFPAPGDKAVSTGATSYASWAVKCTPDAPWLKIRTNGALYKDGSGVPYAASCEVTGTINATLSHSIKVVAFKSIEWGSMRLSDDSQPGVAVSGVEVTVNGDAPKVGARNNDQSPNAKAVPPARYVADCGSGSSFDVLTGDILLGGERVLTLGTTSGRLGGSPSPFLFSNCPGQARCSKQLSCKIYGLLGFSGSRLETTLTVNAYDDICWAKVETGHFETHGLGGGSNCREWCRTSPTCAAYSEEAGQCLSMRYRKGGQGPVTYVKILGCSRYTTCLHLAVSGEDWLSGAYCPTTVQDGGLPFYTKEGVAGGGYDSIHLHAWRAEREIWDPTACGSNTQWVLRRAMPTEDFTSAESNSVEFRGQVVGCIDTDLSTQAFDENKLSMMNRAGEQVPVLLAQSQVQAVPAARDCASPLEEDDEQKVAKESQKKGQEKREEEEEEKEGLDRSKIFVFDDPGTQLVDDYFLDACECFNEDFAGSSFVNEEAWGKMPAGSNNVFVPTSLEILSGGASCEPQHLISADRTVDDADGCLMSCKETAGCLYFWHGDYNGVKLCRKYSACGSLYREVNSNGQLKSFITGETCLVSDPERCWAEQKRREMLANQAPSSSCVNEALLQACDELLLLGGYGIETCSRCTHNYAVTKKPKKPMPATMLAGTVLSVSCASGFRGAELGNGQSTSQESLTCVDGQWKDSKGRRSLSHFQCQSCVQVSQMGLKTYIHSSKQETWFYNKIGKEIRSGDMTASECLIPTLLEVPPFSREVSFQDWFSPVPVTGRTVHADFGQGYRSRGSVSFGWRAQSGAGCDFPAGSPVAFGAKLGASIAGTASGWKEVTGFTTSVSSQLFNSGDHLNLANGRFTAPVTGYYHFSTNMRLDLAVGSYFRVFLFVNSGKNGNFPGTLKGSPLGNYYTLSTSGSLWLGAGQYVSVWIYSGADTSYTIQSESGFSGHLISTGGVGFHAYKASADAVKKTGDVNVQGYALASHLGGSSSSMSGLSATLGATNHHSSSGWKEITGWSTNGANMFGSALSNGRFTAPSTGVYQVSCNLRLDNANGNYFRVLIAIDGNADVHNGLHTIQGRPGKPYYTLPVMGTVKLSAGQYVSCWAYSNSDTSWSIQRESGFSVAFLGDVISFHANKWTSQLRRTPPSSALVTNFPYTPVSASGWYKRLNWDVRQSLLSSAIDSAGGDFIAPADGVYHVGYHQRLDGAGGSYFRILVAVNHNVDVNNGLHSILGNPTAPYYSLTLAGDVLLSAGDKLTAYIYSNSDTSWVAYSESGLSIHPVRGAVAFHVDLSAGRAVSSTGWTTVGNWRSSGTAGLFTKGGGFATSTGKFTAPQAGIYHFSGNVRLDGMGGSFFRLSMAKNGATSFSPMHVIQGSPESSYVTMNVYGLFQMNQGDTAELKVNSYNDNSYTIQAESGFSGHLLETTEAFMAYKASHQYVTTSGTTEITPWSTTGSTMYTHHANFDGTSFVASTSGFYHVSANIRLDRAGTGYFRLFVLINGASNIRNGLHTIKSNTVNSYFSMNLDGNIQVNAGDRISLAVLSSSDTAYTVQAESGFAVYFVDSNAAGASGQFAVVPTWRTSGSAGLMDQGDAFNETTGHFHAPSTGYYHVSGNVRLDVLGGSYSRLVVAIDDSPDANAGLHAIQGNPDPTYVTSSVAGDVYLAAGQTLSLFVYSHTDWNYNVQGESGFSVHSLGSSVIGFAADMDTAMSLSGGSDTRVQTWRTTAAGNFNSGHFHTGTGIFTAPLAGWYLFSANVRFDSVPDTSYVRLMIGVDGKPSANDGAHAISGAPHQPYYTLSLETARYIDKGQQVALYVILSNSGDSCTIQSESGFSGHLIESRTATGFDTKLGDFKAPTTGYYALDAGVRLDGAAGTYTRARIAINDQSTNLNGLHSIEGSPEASYYTHSLSGVAKLNAGDTAHLVVFSASDTDYTINTDTVFSGVLIGDQIHGFHAGKTRSQSVTGTGWSEVTGWSTSSYLGQFDAGNVMDGTKFRPNRAGFYHLSALIRLDAVGQVLSSNYVRVEICRHDSCITGQSHSIQGSPKNNYFTLRTSGSMYMGSGDSASVFVYSNADASFTIQSESGFSGYLLTTPQEAALTATVLDPQDVCVNTRWEMQVPNGVYMITATYGSPLHSFQTHGCTIEGFSASVGDVPAGQLVSISMQLQVNDGYLTFQGEKASGCTGINRIVVEVANMVQWGRCNLGGWRMNEAQSSDGAYQLEFVPNSGSVTGMCLVNTGGLSVCGTDENQMHRLDHFPVLVSKWTHWISGQVFEGTCAKGVGSDVSKLTTHGTVECGTGSALRKLDFAPRNGCGAGNTHQYVWQCSAFIQTPNTQCVQKETSCASITGDLSNWRLDKYRLECPQLTALKSFRFESCGASSYKYVYTCCSVPGMGGCEVRETDWAEGAGGTLEHLSGHSMACEQGEAMRGFVLDSKVPVSNPGRGEIRYIYACCTVPVALPISVVQTSSLAGSFDAWEGGYCPHGSVEGRLTFSQDMSYQSSAGAASGNLLQYDMHAGEWCVAGICVAHGVAHPIELPKEPNAAFQVSPNAPLNGEYEGKGVMDYEAPPAEEEQGGGDGGLLPDPSKKKSRKSFQPSDFTLDTNFVSSVTFTPWKPTDCSDTAALPTEGPATGSPTDRCYLAFCKARNANGVENFDGTRGPVATAIQEGTSLLSQEGVAEEHPCYHAFNDQTNKRELGGSIWDITNAANAYSQAGLNVESLYWCSARDIERTRQLDNRDGDGQLVDAFSDLASGIADLACDATPEGMAIIAPMGVGAGMAWDTEELCDDITAAIGTGVEFINHVDQAAWTYKFAANDAADCNPLQEGLQRIYCDLYCIEDAVRKGDQSILDTLGNMYEKIKLTTKEMFDFYIAQVLGKMGVLEGSMFGRFDAISDEIMNLDVKVGDQVNVKTGDLDTQLKDIIAKLNKDLDVSTGTIDGKVDSIASAVGALQVESIHSVKQSMQGLMKDLHRQVQGGHLDQKLALRELKHLDAFARQQAHAFRGNASAGNLRAASAALHKHTQGARQRTGWARGKALPQRAAEQSEEHLNLVEDVLHSSRKHTDLMRRKVHAGQKMQQELRQTFASLAGEDTLEALKNLELISEKAHLEDMLVEFDKQWTALSQSTSQFLQEAEEHHEAVQLSATGIRSYTKCNGGDYSGLLEEYKQLQRKRKLLESSLQSSYSDMEQHLTLLANILVDGGLLDSHLALSARLAPQAAERIAQKAQHEAKGFFKLETMDLLQEELWAQLKDGMPKQLLLQTKGAFRLAEHLAARHLSAGLQPSEEQTTQMRSAWRMVQRRFAAMQRLVRKPEFLKKLAALSLEPLLPKAPETCGDGHLWANVTAGGENPRLLVLPKLSALQLLQAADQKETLELGKPGLILCEHKAGQWRTAPPVVESVVLCGEGGACDFPLAKVKAPETEVF